ncbi:SAF domain-containing protein [Kineococcus gynurae]|uniref:SAF domain-containing protein n=1 Tax=Kineococcus gynurae TaxID=452979 RepID=A0ABV5LXP1_9ACTN
MRAATLDRPAREATRRPLTPVRERRPGLAALGAVLVLGGTLGGALLVHRSGDRAEVVVVTRDVAPGARITAEDLGTTRVAADGAALVPAASAAAFVGSSAGTRIPAGTLLNPAMTVAGDAVPEGAVVVGAVLSDAQRPSAPLAVGDVVRVFLVADTAAATGAAPAAGSPGDVLVPAARVLATGAGADAAAGAGLTAAGTGSDTVSLLVDEEQAPAVVAAAAAGQIALVRLAATTTPTVDLLRAG